MICDDCIIYGSLNKVKKVKQKDRICTCCELMQEYAELTRDQVIDITEDCSKFNYYRDRRSVKLKKRSGKNASNNKSHSKRTISKSRKFSKNKSK